jgi:hypothetical protein
LANRAVLGEYQPHRWIDGKSAADGRTRRVPDGPALLDYFPAIIDPALFHKAREARAARDKGAGSGRKGRTFTNLFSRLARCAYCGSSMRYDYHGHGQNRYLVCSAGRRGSGCDERTGWNYPQFEATFFKFMHKIDWSVFAASNEQGDKRTDLVDELTGLRGELEDIEAKQEAALDLLSKKNVDVVQRRIEKLDEKAVALKAELAAGEAELAAFDRTTLALNEGRNHLEALMAKGKDYRTRAAINAHLKAMVGAIYVAPAGTKKGMVIEGFKVKSGLPFQNYQIKGELMGGKKVRHFYVMLKTGDVVVITDANGGYRVLGHTDPAKIEVDEACAV